MKNHLQKTVWKNLFGCRDMETSRYWVVPKVRTVDHFPLLHSSFCSTTFLFMQPEFFLAYFIKNARESAKKAFASCFALAFR